MPTIDHVLASISTVSRRRDLWSLVLDYYHGEGIKMVSYYAVRADTSRTNSSLIDFATDGFPKEWVCKYINKDLVKIDPIPDLAAKLAEPFYWHDLRALAPKSAPTETYLKSLEDSNLGDGIALYVYGPAMQNACVGLGFGQAHAEISCEKTFAYQCVAQAAHLRMCTLLKTGKTKPNLSSREQEVLELVATGKSNSVIATILSLSPHTIDSHMRSIYRKLDVVDRTSAAIRGIGRGLVQYPA